jgi:hypothetical protein
VIDWKTTTVCCCANPVCLEKGCQLQAYQTFPSVSVKYVPVAVPDERAAAERAAIVKWLRYEADVFLDDEAPLRRAADRIESGEHLKGEDR